MIDWEKILMRLIAAGLVGWSMWLSARYNKNVEGFTSALSTFNANFGPALPAANREEKK